MKKMGWLLFYKATLVLTVVFLVAGVMACSGGKVSETAAIEDTISGYVTMFNAEDFDNCLTYFTGYGDKEDALSFLSFTRSLSGELELKKIEGITIIPVAVPGGSRTATANVTFTMVGEEGTDQMRLMEVDNKWKLVWEQEQQIGAYQLTHSLEDAEYILNWDLIVSKCPDISSYDKIDVFAYRGESKQITPGENFTVEGNSPAAWASSRFVRTLWSGTNYRSFAVQIMFSENEAGLDELVQMLGFPVQKEGDFVTGTIEDEAPMQTLQFLLAGNHVVIIIAEVSSRDESPFFTKDALSELLSIAKSNISNLEFTSLPSNIPVRSSQ